MDDLLVQRWKAGESGARTAVRNGVRSIAERVLTHPALRGALGPTTAERFSNSDERRAITAAVADEVLKRGADSSAQLTALSLLVVGRHVVAGMQEGRPSTEEAHLPPQVAVTYALSPEAVAPRIREAADKHLSRCGLCKEDLRIVRNVVRSQGAIDRDAEPTRLADEVAQVRASDGDDADIAEAMEASLAEVEGEAAPPPRSARPGRQPPARRVLPRPEPRQPRGGAWKAAIPLVLVVGGLAWYASTRDGSEGPLELEGLPGLADLSPPRVNQLASLPPGAQAAVGNLESGDCRTAAGRFRSLRTAQDDELRLYMLEGASFVCAGDGRRAMRAFDDMDERIADSEGALVAPRQAAWYRAQAQLLTGDGRGALDSLRQAELADSAHRDLAVEQLSAIVSMMDE